MSSPVGRPPSPTTPKEVVIPSEYDYLYSIGMSFSIGGAFGLLASIPVNRYFFSMNPVAGFVSGAVAGLLYSQSSLKEFTKLSSSEKLGAMVSFYAIQVFATYGICLISQTPINFTAALLFPVASVPVILITAAIGLFLINFGAAGETVYNLYTKEPRYGSDEGLKAL